MGRNAGVTADPKQAVDRFTEEAIVAGDLLWMGEDGLVKKVPVGLGANTFASDTEGLTPVKTLGDAALNIPATGFPGSIVYVNGYIFQGYHVIAGSGVNVVKKDLNGNILTTVSVVTGSPLNFRLVALSSSVIAVVYALSSSLYFKLLDTNLGSVSSIVTVESVNNFAAYDLFSACKLTDGKLLVAWRTNTNSDLYASIYDAAGAPVVVDIPVFTTGTPAYISCCPLDSGGFAVSWFSSTHQFARFDSSGNLVGSIVSIAGSTDNAQTVYLGERIKHLASNAIAIQYYDGVARPLVAIYNSSNTLVGGFGVTEATTQDKEIPMTVCEGGVACAYLSGTETCKIVLLSADGTTTRLPSLSISGATKVTNIHYLPSVGFVVTGDGFIFVTDVRGALIGNSVSTALVSAISVVAEDLVLYAAGYGTVYKDVAYKVQRASIAGVALNFATASRVKVARKGVYTLTETYVKGVVFNNSTFAVKGAAGIVNENRATLFGVSE